MTCVIKKDTISIGRIDTNNPIFVKKDGKLIGMVVYGAQPMFNGGKFEI